MTAIAIPFYSAAWIDDCQEFHGRVLTGRFAHWCAAWDDLPIDETCQEWPCPCAPELERDDPSARTLLEE